jgi:hypothetical protein
LALVVLFQAVEDTDTMVKLNPSLGASNLVRSPPLGEVRGTPAAVGERPNARAVDLYAAAAAGCAEATPEASVPKVGPELAQGAPLALCGAHRADHGPGLSMESDDDADGAPAPSEPSAPSGPTLPPNPATPEPIPVTPPPPVPIPVLPTAPEPATPSPLTHDGE